MSLGKGLESLIPSNKGNQSQGTGAPQSQAPQAKPEPAALPAEPAVTPAASPSFVSSAPAPADLPVHEEFLPAPEEEKLLEAAHDMQPAPVEIKSTSPAQPAAPFSAPKDEEPVPKSLWPDDVPRDKERLKDDAIFYLETAKIRPNENQPRKHFDEAAIKDLADSIREFGILQPIVVMKHEKEVPDGTEVDYELLAGERRLRAAKSLGMERIPAIIRRVEVKRERLELAIIENLQREDLNSIEMARAFARLQDEFRLTQREIAQRLGKSRETVANTLRLLDLPTYIQDAIGDGRISESHGLFFLGVEPNIQKMLFDELIANKLTIRELRDRAKRLNPRKRMVSAELPGMTPEMKMFEEKLASELGAPVSIQQKGQSGKITIDFYSKEELEQIVSRMSKAEE